MGTMLWLLHVLVLMIHQARILLLVEAQNNGGGTTFTFPPFNTTSNLLYGGDIQLTEDAVFGTSEVTLNTGNQINLTTPGTCASLLYGKPLQMQGTSSSFTTAFTFSITGTYSAGFAFVFLPQNHTTGIPGGKLCLMPRALDPTTSQFFAVEFDTFKNPEFDDPSNNHVGVNINSMNSSFTYNLCGDGVEACSYLVYDYMAFNIVHDFTSWIDYDSVTKTVAVFLTNGSTLQDISKPASAIIREVVDLEGVMSEEMFVGFSGATNGYDQESKRILSWSFSTDATHIEGSPTSGPGNNGSSPRPPGSSPGTTVLTGGSSGSSNGFTAKLAVGIVVGVAVLFAIAIGYKLFRLFRRPLRIFLSHAGGEDQGGKNFPDWLYNEMTASWKLKRFIKVFLDRRCLPKGKRFPNEIMQALEKTELGIVVVTPEFFTRRWPMTELISFVRSQEYNPSVRILPLFYQMSVSQVRDHLADDESVWEAAWQEMFSDSKHQIVPGDCRAALKRLCEMNGIEYTAKSRGHDLEYIQMSVGQVREHLRDDESAWEEAWQEMFSDNKHQILPGDCRAAVKRLCEMNGIEYSAKSRGHDLEYIQLILKVVGRILREGLWKR